MKNKLLKDLMGLSLNQEIKTNKNTYSVFIQFDNDKPKLLVNDVLTENDITFTLNNKNKGSSFEFKDLETGKIFKIFTK